MPLSIVERARRIRLVVFDVDGVLSDGAIAISASGELFKSFNVKDGLGIKLLQQAGIRTAILTGRTSEIVARRAAELGIERVEQGQLKKGPALRAMLEQFGIEPEAVAYMGDDLPDLPAMRMVGLAARPADGHAALEPYVHWTAPHAGGHGAVRDFAELILTAQHQWQRLLESNYLSD